MTQMPRFYIVLDKILRVQVKDAVRDAKAAAAYHDSPAIQEMNTEFSALDAKASALISHLSLMIAAISILHGTVAQQWLKVGFLLEIIFYLFTLICVIRVIYYSYYSDISGGDHNITIACLEMRLMDELKTRMFYYRLAHHLTNVGTIALVASLALTILFS